MKSSTPDDPVQGRMRADKKNSKPGHKAVDDRVKALMGLFPRGLSLSQEDLALIAWIYLYEEETGTQGISDFHFKGLLEEGVRRFSWTSAAEPFPVIQRLMRFGLLRIAVPDSNRRGYRLTSFGRGLARHLIEEADYGAEALNVLLDSGFIGVQSTLQGDGTLLKYLQHVFLGTIREKVEHKILTIEEDLERRKAAVRQTYSGQDQPNFEAAIQDIEYCRRALTELVDAVQESSAWMRLEESFHQQLLNEPETELYGALEQSLLFLYTLRAKIDEMLKDVIQFIRDCIAYRSLAFTVDSRDRLCRIQEKILSFALEHDVRMPVLGALRVPRLDLQWSKAERERPVMLNVDGLMTLEDFLAPGVPAVEPEWKGAFVQRARESWVALAREGGVDLDRWVKSLGREISGIQESPHLAVWFLCQDWPNWSPGVVLEYTGEWVPLGRGWMMEAIRLVPVK